jgi:hypothetical protein
MDSADFNALLGHTFTDPLEQDVREDIIGCPGGVEFLVLVELRRISTYLAALQKP